MIYKKVDPDKELQTLVSLAQEIWSQHFGTLFDQEVLAQLIDTAQSKQAMLKQLNEGYHYYLIEEENGTPIGYFAYLVEQNIHTLFISKLYLLSHQRGKGVGRMVLAHLEALGRKHKLNKLSLTVYHKNTTAVKAYEKWGFNHLGLIERTFDNGLVFKDIKMEKPILP